MHSSSIRTQLCRMSGTSSLLVGLSAMFSEVGVPGARCPVTSGHVDMQPSDGTAQPRTLCKLCPGSGWCNPVVSQSDDTAPDPPQSGDAAPHAANWAMTRHHTTTTLIQYCCSAAVMWGCELWYVIVSMLQCDPWNKLILITPCRLR